MSLSHFFSITQTWRIAISWLDTPGRILSSTWYHQWLQLVTPMRQNAQKRSRKFCRSKEDKNGETHPKSSKKGETGCVLGAGGGSSGWRRMRADGKGRSEQGRGGRLLLSLAKMEGRTCLACRLARPSARGFGVDVGERSRERRRARCHPVPAASPRKAGAGLVL